MSNEKTIRLHSKLYRARAIDEAIKLMKTENNRFVLKRSRQEDYHCITLKLDENTTDFEKNASEILARLADTALIITVDQDR